MKIRPILNCKLWRSNNYIKTVYIVFIYFPYSNLNQYLIIMFIFYYDNLNVYSLLLFITRPQTPDDTYFVEIIKLNNLNIGLMKSYFNYTE